jgi:hypothetical protein
MAAGMMPLMRFPFVQVFFHFPHFQGIGICFLRPNLYPLQDNPIRIVCQRSHKHHVQSNNNETEQALHPLQLWAPLLQWLPTSIFFSFCFFRQILYQQRIPLFQFIKLSVRFPEYGMSGLVKPKEELHNRHRINTAKMIDNSFPLRIIYPLRNIPFFLKSLLFTIVEIIYSILKSHQKRHYMHDT